MTTNVLRGNNDIRVKIRKGGGVLSSLYLAYECYVLSIVGMCLASHTCACMHA